MSNYTPIVNFAAKDALPPLDPAKRARGTEISAELNAIQTAIASKEDSANKNQINGFAGLDGSGKVSLSVLPTGIVRETEPATVTGAWSFSTSFTISSNALITNLNADLLDGQHGAYYRAWANLTGVPSSFTPSAHTHPASDITAGTFPGGTFNFSGTLQYGGVEVGYRGIPRLSTTGRTLVASDNGTCVASTGSVEVPSGVFSPGNAVTVYNNSGTTISLTQGSGLTLRTAGTATTGTISVNPRGFITVWFNSDSEAIAAGNIG